MPALGQVGVAAVSGAASGFAFAPFYLWPLLLAGVVCLVWLLDERGGVRRAALLGWAFGVGYFAVSLSWVAVAFRFQAEMPSWMGYLGVAALAAVLALYTGAATALAASLWSPSPLRALVLAASWSLAEWGRNNLPVRFPWNSVAQVWADMPIAVQAVAVLGSYGLSLLTIALFASLAVLVDRTATARRLLVVLLAVSGAALAYGAQRIWSDGMTKPAAAMSLRVHLVQADVTQDIKWDPHRQLSILERYEAMTAAAVTRRGPGLIVWPESATLYDIEDAGTRARLARLLPAGGRLVLGAVRYVREGDRVLSARNSLLLLDSKGRIEAAYDKARLVPFGEYLPARTWLERLGLSRLVPGQLTFVPGAGPSTLTVPGIPAFSPLICYEIIFPDRAVDNRSRPVWLLNLSNDAWFGTSSGPHQHLAQARLRAVEQGLPVVRSTPTGISAIIDPYGRIVKQLPLGARGVLTGDLPAGLPPTLYSRLGDRPFLLITFVLLVTGALIRRRVAKSVPAPTSIMPDASA